MKTLFLLSVVALGSLVSCSSSGTSSATPESFDTMYAATAPAGNNKTVFGTWGLTKNESGFTIDARVTLTADKVRLASRCSKDGAAATAGVSVAAVVSETHVSVKEAKTDSKPVGGTNCGVQITAGEAVLTLDAGKLNFGNIFLFDTKYSD
jgi:hypothetical protein